MDKLEFVRVVKTQTSDSATESAIHELEHPSGRSPSSDALERSNWFHSLSTGDQEILKSILLDVAERAVFGFFAILDGARPIEDESVGHLELRYVRESFQTQLNDDENEELHDLFNQIR